MNEQLIDALASQVKAAISDAVGALESKLSKHIDAVEAACNAAIKDASENAATRDQVANAVDSGIADIQSDIKGAIDKLSVVSSEDFDAFAASTGKQIKALSDAEHVSPNAISTLEDRLSSLSQSQVEIVGQLRSELKQVASDTSATDEIRSALEDLAARVDGIMVPDVSGLEAGQKSAQERIDKLEELELPPDHTGTVESLSHKIEALECKIDQMPSTANGKDGSPGKDAVEIDILPSIHADKSYPFGIYAQHEGGVWRAVRETDPLGDDAAKSGWVPVIRGVKAIEVHHLSDGVVAVKSILSGGSDHIHKIDLGGLYYKGIWQEGEYAKNAAVTYGGSLWVAQRDTDGAPGRSSDWVLAVKKGKDKRVAP